LGREVIQAYRDFETRVQDEAARHFMRLARRARKVPVSRARAAPVMRMNTR
jgi:hypothetical protein